MRTFKMEMINKLPPEIKLTKTGTTKQNSMGLFLCPTCKLEVVKIRNVGRIAITCGSVGCKPSGPHGKWKHPIKSVQYIAWSNMRGYCQRHIVECSDDWNSFDVFYENIGLAYVEGSRLARKDVISGFSLANCYWKNEETYLDSPTNSTQRSVTTGRLFEQHGMHNTRPYRIWANMKLRCYSPTNIRYQVYGGKGVIVCEEWKESFISFWKDMKEGYSDEMTIDRIDSAGNYTKNNCRWISLAENSGRSRALVTSQIDKITGVVIKEWASARVAGIALGIDPSSIIKVCKGSKISAGGFKWMNA